jgi:hypothetical protein
MRVFVRVLSLVRAARVLIAVSLSLSRVCVHVRVRVRVRALVVILRRGVPCRGILREHCWSVELPPLPQEHRPARVHQRREPLGAHTRHHGINPGVCRARPRSRQRRRNQRHCCRGAVIMLTSVANATTVLLLITTQGFACVM